MKLFVVPNCIYFYSFLVGLRVGFSIEGDLEGYLTVVQDACCIKTVQVLILPVNVRLNLIEVFALPLHQK